MESLVRKRRLESSTPSDSNCKRSRTSCSNSYESPLIHFGKTKFENNRSVSLDDSIIVIEDRTSLPKSHNRSTFVGEEKQAVCLDNSVIILSDDEEEAKIGEDSELAVITTVTKEKKKQRISTRLTTLTHKAKVRAKNDANKGKLPVNKSLTSKQCSELDSLELPPVAIDAEDENTIPNDDSSKLNSKVEIIIVDCSPGIERKNQASSSRIRKAAVDILDKNSNAAVVAGGDVSPERSSAASERLAFSCSVPSSSKSKKCSLFYTDTQGNTKDSQYSKAKNSKKRKARRCNEKSRNCNWASFVKTGSTKSSVVKDRVPMVEQPQEDGIGSYYTNETMNKEPGSLRDIIIDGSNIAMSYTKNGSFSEDGLKLVIDYFTLRGHTVKVFIPQHRRSFKFPLLEELHTEGIVVFTPSRTIGGKKISSYDDRFILDYATMCDGIVVSLDQYRDLYKEKHKWRHTIENRLLIPTFVGKCVMFPEDPLGQRGPKLDEFLRH